jgi:hypothetical protein
LLTLAGQLKIGRRIIIGGAPDFQMKERVRIANVGFGAVIRLDPRETTAGGRIGIIWADIDAEEVRALLLL